VVRGALGDRDLLMRAMAGADAVVHAAGDYRIGIARSERPAMFSTNVDGTRTVLDAAARSGVGLVVHVSTFIVHGDTRGHAVGEEHERSDRSFLSYYDETKFLAHEMAADAARHGLPVLIVEPSQMYGPGDHSEVGAQIARACRGAYRIRIFPSLGLSMAYVDDVADGIARSLDRGQVGERYVLGGENVTLGDLLDRVARAAGHHVPHRTVPAGLVRALAPLGPLIGPRLGGGPDLGESLRSADGVTYWASSDKARAALGYHHRDLDAGLETLLAATA
jgi:dihydroflavonol-4-reductase